MSKISLHDGVSDVKDIAVISLFRNNALYLQSYFFPKLIEMEGMYDVTFHYFFLENNSNDDTRAILKSFIEPRQGRLITLDLPDFENRGTNYERTHRLAGLRNKIIDEIIPIKAPWSLLIDSEIYFDTQSLSKLFKHQPKKFNVGLLGPFSREGILGRNVNKVNERFKDMKDDQMLITNHYYDSFAFVDTNSKNYWPRCAFDSCDHCKKNLIPRNKGGLIFVKSCYGGFTIVDTEIFNDYREQVRWDTIDLFGHTSLCEHVLFNVKLQAATGKKVAIASDVDQVFWTG